MYQPENSVYKNIIFIEEGTERKKTSLQMQN